MTNKEYIIMLSTMEPENKEELLYYHDLKEARKEVNIIAPGINLSQELELVNYCSGNIQNGRPFISCSFIPYYKKG